MMKRPAIFTVMVLAFLAGFQCLAGAEEAVRKYFPECFADARIGASSGAKCEQDMATKEWKIVFWTGWGDCPAGCINKKDVGWYKVDGKSRVLSCDADFKSCREIKPSEIKRGGPDPSAGPAPDKPSKPAKPGPTAAKPPAKPALTEKTYCEAQNECFWYSCCETAPMSKRYSRKHLAELWLDSADRESCSLKCMHEFPPADQKVACVYYRCQAVPKDAPAIDPKRPTVWVGRSRVIGQCQDPASSDSPILLANLPAPLMKTYKGPIPLGPKFSAWIGAQEKWQRDSDPNKFTCKACDVCNTFAREYLLIYLDDLPKYESGPGGFKRVDE
jgi:hypothetical protein